MKKLCVLMLLLLCGCSYGENRARFLFIGDIMVHDQQLDAARRRDGTYDFSPSFRRVKPLLRDSFLAGNLETVFAGAGKKLRYAGYPLFNTPDTFIGNLSGDLGADLLTLANNHIFDRGADGARRTAEILTSSDIPWIGLGVGDIPPNDAVILSNSGIRAAFINHSYGSNLWPKSSGVHLNVYGDDDIIQSMTRAKSLSPDIIIALFHWGNEYHHKPNVHQKRAADTALREGASLVVGTHPHVLQPVDVIVSGDSVRAVAWSLGNFVSFQRTRPRERSMILSAEFVKDGSGTRLSGLSAAPLYVVAPGSKRTEVTYAGDNESLIESLDFDGLSKPQVNNLRSVGHAVNEFLGAQKIFDSHGFNVLWTEESPDILPRSRRKSPM